MDDLTTPVRTRHAPAWRGGALVCLSARRAYVGALAALLAVAAPMVREHTARTVLVNIHERDIPVTVEHAP